VLGGGGIALEEIQYADQQVCNNKSNNGQVYSSMKADLALYDAFFNLWIIVRLLGILKPN
jgi:hypothetical protein